MSQDPSGPAEPSETSASDGPPPYDSPCASPHVSPYTSRYAGPAHPGLGTAPVVTPYLPAPPPPSLPLRAWVRIRWWTRRVLRLGLALGVLLVSIAAFDAVDRLVAPPHSAPSGYRLTPPPFLDGLRAGPDPIADFGSDPSVHWVDRAYGEPVDNGLELYGSNDAPAEDPARRLRESRRDDAKDRKTSVFAQVTAVDPGSHGGAMACGSTNDGYVQTVFCYWASETSQFSLFAYNRPDYTNPSELAALARRIRAEDEVPDSG